MPCSKLLLLLVRLPFIVLLGVLLKLPAAAAQPAQAPASAASARPALTVSLVSPTQAPLGLQVGATGSIAAWQEASVGAELGGVRLAQVKAGVGDAVKRGQVLAEFATETVAAELAQLQAQGVEAEAQLAEAAANARRARELQDSGAWSRQQIEQHLTAERTAQARLDAVRAGIRVQELRLQQTRVLAPDDGVISARSATLGAVANPGQELFRLIRQGRLEWRAEVAAADLSRLKPGLPVRLSLAGGELLEGRVRLLAPTVDPATRNALVYVDLPRPGPARAGMFARGSFELGSSPALSLPQTAVQLRDGFSYVFRVGPDRRVAMTKVALGRRAGDRVEILSGLDAAAQVVASGVGFLADGDLVKVVGAPAPVAAAAPAAPAASR
jgi:RND family efflux transporter MFP subunit